MDNRRNRYSDVSCAFIQIPLMQIRLGIERLEIVAFWFEKLGESLNHLSNLQSQPSNSPEKHSNSPCYGHTTGLWGNKHGSQKCSET